jgi:hypothetical protein
MLIEALDFSATGTKQITRRHIPENRDRFDILALRQYSDRTIGV